MFLFGRIFRTVFFGCVFATVFCVSGAVALPDVVAPGGSGGSSSSGETTSTTTSGIASVGYVKEVIATKENTTNKVTSLTSSATNTQYPSALAVYSAVSERVSHHLRQINQWQANIMSQERFLSQIYHCPQNKANFLLDFVAR